MLKLLTDMTQKSELGRVGEDFACGYLVKNGYKIIERNYRKSWGELDIVAKAKDKTLVLVEVKTMKNNFCQDIEPEDQMTFSKIKKFKKAAELYVGSHESLIDDKKGWRLDAIALLKDGKEFVVRHYENIT